MAIKVTLGTTLKKNFSLDTNNDKNNINNDTVIKTYAVSNSIMPLAESEEMKPAIPDAHKSWSLDEWETAIYNFYTGITDTEKTKDGLVLGGGTDLSAVDEMAIISSFGAENNPYILAIQAANPNYSTEDAELYKNTYIEEIYNETAKDKVETYDAYFPYVNEFGHTSYISVQVNKADKDRLDAILGDKTLDELGPEQLQAYEDLRKELTSKAQKQAEKIYASGTNDAMEEMDDDEREHLTTWDPRLLRVDAFFMSKDGKTQRDDGLLSGTTAVIVPFSTVTAATAFRDLVFVQHRHFASKLQEAFNSEGYPSAEFAGADNEVMGEYKEPDYTTAETVENTNNEQLVLDFQTWHPGAIPIAFNTNQYYSDPIFYGTASLMNLYSLTKLCGGLDNVQKTGNDGVVVKENYMYDVRDNRRFYGLNIGNSIRGLNSYALNQSDTSHPLNVSVPTVSNIIKWANADKWGRTPYTYQDFVYSKWFGIIPNNRLLTLRRYHAPTLDNLQFDGMVKPNGAGNGYTTTNAFSPRCTVVTYIGGDTGNKFADLLKFSTGLGWDDAEAKIWDVSGSEGDDPQGKIDEMFESGGFGSAESPIINRFLQYGNTAVGSLLSFGKFLGIGTGNIKVGMSQGAFDNLSQGNKDPYGEGSYENRIQGPINRINKVKRRKEEITFDQSFTVKCTYTAKSIGGINPKAAMLDILANCLEMVSADAVFWGGGHRFNILPKLYPYHDGGMRDNFMKKLFDGKIFGEGGAIDYVFSGIKSFWNETGGDTIWEKIGTIFSDFWGGVVGAVGSLLGSISGSIFGESTGDATKTFLSGFSNNETAKKKGAEMMTNLGKGLNKMWKNKVMENTAVPNIKVMNALLIGDPVGEWHLTVGNPLNPIAVIGNLICEKMDVDFSETLGPDDFPEEMTVTYTLQHGMMRDKSGIQSMFNRGMGKIYELPDYIRSSSDFETHVDYYTMSERTAFRKPQYVNGAAATNKGIHQMYGSAKKFQSYSIDPGHKVSWGNPNTSIVTKFLPIPNSNQADIIGNHYGAVINSQTNMPIIKALSVTRKYRS